ncbi:MAG: glycosyltransferase family 2 protein [Epsilonproteobacteria bacterium]|nr:glycosyltransferase family 2 protein [Campylobacterota bacterium]
MHNLQTNDKSPVLSIVCPAYNEAPNIRPFLQKLIPVLEKIGESYEIIFVNDGSTDDTLESLIDAKKEFPPIRIINLSRNFGKEAALTAGIDHARGQAVIPIDADLQHPPELIEEMVKKWKEGYDVVAAKRLSRTGEHPLKKLSARLFYNLHNKISDIDIPADIGDFRLMSRKVVEALKLLPENQRFMKGIFAWVGFKTAVVEYYQEERHAGTSSFNAWKLWNFALDGITSFSTVPLRVWFYIGLVISGFSFLLGVYIVLEVLVDGIDVPGYASTILMVLFLGGIQLIGIGILGEYIGRIFKEVKRRPTYIVEDEY